MKPIHSKHQPDYNPALPETHGDGLVSDEYSGDIGMQEALKEGVEDADRTRPVDVDIHERHH